MTGRSIIDAGVATPNVKTQSTEPAAAVSTENRVWRLFVVTMSLVGWVCGFGIFLILISKNGFEVGGDLAAYLRAGDDLLAGGSVYFGVIGEVDVFSYAPPWAVVFAAFAWVPDMAMQSLVMGVGLLAIRYVCGSWLMSGLVFLYPISIMVLMSGNIEFLISGAIVLAWRGHPGPLVLTSFAKVAPILALPRVGWKEVAVTVALALLITLPWLHLWADWFEYLLRQPTSTATHFGPPWYLRLPLAMGLMLLRRPWASATAVVVAMPAWWLGTLVILPAAVRLWLDGRRSPTA